MTSIAAQSIRKVEDKYHCYVKNIERIKHGKEFDDRF